MIYKKLCGVLLLSITFDAAWAMDLTNPTTLEGQDCVTVKTLEITEVESGLYNVDVEIIGHCIEQMNVKVCPSHAESRCEFHVLPRGERIKTQLNATNEMADVYYEWGFYDTSPALASQASAPNWNFIEATYLSADFDGFDQDVEPTGYGVKGSTLVGGNVILSASYSSISVDVANVDVELNQASVGIGYRYGATNSTDLFMMASYLYSELEISANGNDVIFDENGYGLEVGVRSMLSEYFEAVATIGYVEIDSESDTGIAVSAYYHFNKQFAIGVGYSVADDVDMYNASLRLSF